MAWVPQASCFEHIGYGHLGLVPVVDELHPDKAIFTRRSLLEKLWAIEGLDEVDHAGIDGAPAVIVDKVIPLAPIYLATALLPGKMRLLEMYHARRLTEQRNLTELVGDCRAWRRKPVLTQRHAQHRMGTFLDAIE